VFASLASSQKKRICEEGFFLKSEKQTRTTKNHKTPKPLNPFPLINADEENWKISS